MIGLIQSFFVTTLWKVHDTAGALAMGVFAASLIGYFGYRFSQLRAVVAAGQPLPTERLALRRYILGGPP
jgi:hypothetical protein